MGRIFPEQKLNYATAAPVTFIQTENKNKKAVNILTTFGKNLIKITKHRDMIHLWIVTAEGDPMIYLS